MAESPDSRGVADLHCHTRHSDGQDSPAEVLAWAARLRLDVLAVTDHDSIEGAEIAAELAENAESPPEVIIGEEVSSRDGHILALFISKLVQPGMSAGETVAAIHQQGGIAIAAHPFWRMDSANGRGLAYGVGRLIEDVPFDAIEVTNGGFTPSMISANRKAALAAAELGLTAVGGSDAHVKHALAWANTRFEGRSAADLRWSILAGSTAAGRSRLDPVGITRYAGWTLGRLRPQRVAS